MLLSFSAFGQANTFPVVKPVMIYNVKETYHLHTRDTLHLKETQYTIWDKDESYVSGESYWMLGANLLLCEIFLHCINLDCRQGEYLNLIAL